MHLKGKVFDVLSRYVESRQAVQKKVDMIAQYFLKRRIRLILHKWLPVARQVNQAHNRMVIKARFFAYLKGVWQKSKS